MPGIEAYIAVEVGFGTAAVSLPGAWTDITSYVLSTDGMAVRRGRRAELASKITPGELTLTLDNSDRRFDPTHTSGPYYGDLVPRVPIRVRCQYNSVIYTIFRGVVEAWPQRYSRADDNLPTVQIRCPDAIGFMAAQKAPSSVHAAFVQEVIDSGFDVISWWKLHSPTAVEATTGLRGNIGGAELTDPIVAGEQGATKFTGGGGLIHHHQSLMSPGTGPFTVTMWVRTAEAAPQRSGHPLYTECNDPQTPRWRTGQIVCSYGIEDNRVLQADYNGGTDLSFFVAAEPAEFQQNHTDGAATLFGFGDGSAFTANGRDISLIVDEGPETGTSASFTPDVAMIGCAPVESYWPVSTSTGWLSGSAEIDISDVIVWDAALDETQLGLLLEAGRYTTSDTISGRVDRIFSMTRWPIFDAAEDAGTTIPTPYSGSEGDFLAQLQALEDSCLGRVVATADGTLQFFSRSHWTSETRSTATQFTLDDNVSAWTTNVSGYADAEVVYDDRLLAAQVTVTRRDGAAQTVRDTAADDTYGGAAVALSGVYLPTDEAAHQLADTILQLRKAPVLRVDSITIKPRRDPARLWPFVLGVEEGDRVVVKRQPNATGTQQTFTAHVVGVEHRTTAEDWTTTLHLDAVFVPATSWFIWGTSNWGGSNGWAA